MSAAPGGGEPRLLMDLEAEANGLDALPPDAKPRGTGRAYALLVVFVLGAVMAGVVMTL